MELRKDPITRSWVICGDEPDASSSPDSFCPFCPESGQPLQVIASVADREWQSLVGACRGPSSSAVRH